MRHARVLIAALIGTLLSALPIIGSAEDGAGAGNAAGNAELRALDARIAEIRVLLASDETAMAAKQDEALTLFADRAETFVAEYQPYRGTLPANVQEFPSWYLAALKERAGFDPSAPLNPWQRQWTAVRRAEHAIHDRYEGLRVSLRRLERLRDRLRRQLGLAPEDDR